MSKSAIITPPIPPLPGAKMPTPANARPAPAANAAPPVTSKPVPLKELVIPEEKTIAPVPAGARTHYAGKPACVGMSVWYCICDAFTHQLKALPAILFERGGVYPDLWSISIMYYPGGQNDHMPNVAFSETPKEGHWCWPVLPEAQADKPKDEPN